MFQKAADTYEKIHNQEKEEKRKWEISSSDSPSFQERVGERFPGNEMKKYRFTVHSGDEFVAALREYVWNYGPVEHLEYFWHGNSAGLYINQAPNINGALYANDPRVNEDYIAASIYELPPDTFAKNGTIRFNGCNVAEGHLENKPNLAQHFANYFGITAEAPLGPTEFSSLHNQIKRYPGGNTLDGNFSGPVYLVPTDPERGFITVKPQTPLASFSDIYEGSHIADEVAELVKRGWSLEKMGWTKADLQKNITYADLLALCLFLNPESPECTKMRSHNQDEMARNLTTLGLVYDVIGIPVSQKKTSPWYQKYINYGLEHDLLTDDFIHRKWYTRGELLELVGKCLRSRDWIPLS
jgi:hypothetical protein